MLAWRKGKDYSYCMASNLFNCPWFFLNSRKNKNKSGAVGHLKTEAVERVQFSHVRVFSDSRNVQKRATKSDTSGHCLVRGDKLFTSRMAPPQFRT